MTNLKDAETIYEDLVKARQMWYEIRIDAENV